MSKVIDIATRRPVVSPEAETIFRSCWPTTEWAVIYGKGIAQLLKDDYPNLTKAENQAVAQACSDSAFEAFVGKGCTEDRAHELAEVMFMTMGEVLQGPGGPA